MSKRVAIVLPPTRPVPPIRGGGVQHGVYDVIQYFQRHKPLIISTEDPDLPDVSVAGEVTFYNPVISNSYRWQNFFKFWNRRYFFYYCLRVAEILNQEKPAIVHVRLNPWVMLEISKRLRYRPKLILQHHTLPLAKSFTKYQLKSLLTKIDCFAGVSRFVIQREVTDRRPEFNPRCRLIPNGVRTDLFYRPEDAIQKKRWRQHFGFGEQEIVLLCVGQIREEKGVSTLLAAYRQARQQDRRLKLCLVGSASGGGNQANPRQQAYLERFKKELSTFAPTEIIYMGYCPKEDLPNLYRAVDISIVPSWLEETCNNVMLESLASGLPLLASDRGGIAEYAGPVARFTTCPEKPAEWVRLLTECLSARANWPKIGWAARAHVEKHYTWQKIAELTENIYEDLLKEHR